MNFKALKGMIDSLVKTYKCPECGNEVNENNVDVIGAAGSTINIDVECTNCGKHSMIKSEVLSLDLTNKNVSAQKLEQIKQALTQINGSGNVNVSGAIIQNTDKKTNKIKDKEIVDLNSTLSSETLNVSDLLGDEK
ncbi:MAG: hypothetical protein GY828_02730 [Candidatus Gracilibacteria bacterium]|nr:hypothetical protein [Candidatus Gracilibacteria bacterium]